MRVEKPDFESKLKKAKAYIADHREEEAIELLETLLESRPWAVQVQHLLCTLYLDTGRTDIPSAWVAGAIKEEPAVRENMMKATIRFLQDEELEKSNDIIRSLVWADPGSAEAWALLGSIRFRIGDLWTAEKALLQTLNLDPGDSEATVQLIRLYKELEQPERALDIARDALQAGGEPSPEYAGMLAEALEPLALEEIDHCLAWTQETS
ncbi:MAG: hypothetical protein ABIK28_17740 [Planctomycetota bacterium]